jgi:hypothetical protein
MFLKVFGMSEQFFLISNFHRVVNVVLVVLGDYLMSESYVPTFQNRQGVPKHWHIKLRPWRITQKKEYNKFSKVFCARISYVVLYLVASKGPRC